MSSTRTPRRSSRVSRRSHEYIVDRESQRLQEEHMILTPARGQGRSSSQVETHATPARTVVNTRSRDRSSATQPPNEVQDDAKASAEPRRSQAVPNKPAKLSKKAMEKQRFADWSQKMHAKRYKNKRSREASESSHSSRRTVIAEDESDNSSSSEEDTPSVPKKQKIEVGPLQERPKKPYTQDEINLMTKIMHNLTYHYLEEHNRKPTQLQLAKILGCGKAFVSRLQKGSGAEGTMVLQARGIPGRPRGLELSKYMEKALKVLTYFIECLNSLMLMCTIKVLFQFLSEDIELAGETVYLLRKQKGTSAPAVVECESPGRMPPGIPISSFQAWMRGQRNDKESVITWMHRLRNTGHHDVLTWPVGYADHFVNYTVKLRANNMYHDLPEELTVAGMERLGRTADDNLRDYANKRFNLTVAYFDETWITQGQYYFSGWTVGKIETLAKAGVRVVILGVIWDYEKWLGLDGTKEKWVRSSDLDAGFAQEDKDGNPMAPPKVYSNGCQYMWVANQQNRYVQE